MGNIKKITSRDVKSFKESATFGFTTKEKLREDGHSVKRINQLIEEDYYTEERFSINGEIKSLLIPSDKAERYLRKVEGEKYIQKTNKYKANHDYKTSTWADENLSPEEKATIITERMSKDLFKEQIAQAKERGFEVSCPDVIYISHSGSIEVVETVSRHYKDEYLEQKENFVREVLQQVYGESEVNVTYVKCD